MSSEPKPGPRPFVRPYAVTGGRTGPSAWLAVEALVATTARGREALNRMMPEHEAVCRLCVEYKSVAEIAALVAVPLGVAGVIVGDLAEHGFVHVEQPPAGEAGPDTELLERVLIGLQNL